MKFRVGPTTVSLSNTSRVPSEYLREAAKVVVGTLKPDVKTYLIHVKNARRAYSGNGCALGQTLRLERHWRRDQKWPFIYKDHRYSWSHAYTIANRPELWVFLLGHECAHGLSSTRRTLQDGQYRHLRTSEQEYRCDDLAWKCVEAWQHQKAEAWSRIAAAMRDETRRQRLARQAKTATRRGTPMWYSRKLDQARESLKKWEKRARRAEKSVAKWRRAVQRYEKATYRV